MMSKIVIKTPIKAIPCFTVLWIFLCSITTAADTQSAEEIAEKALAATVHLEVKDRNGKILGFGSGFFIGKNQIATSFHVVEGAAKGTAKLVGKTRKYAIKKIYIKTDKENDLALIRVTPFAGEPLSLGDSDGVKIGQTVYVAGNPKGWEGTFSDGIISSIRGSSTRKLFQMTAPVSSGSSGGPVFNSKGEVIGVSFATFKGGQNLNFAVPSNYLKSLLGRLAPAKPFTQPNARSRRTAPGARRMVAPSKRFTRSMRAKSAEKFFRLGRAKFNSGKHTDAITDFNSAIRLTHPNSSAYYYSSACYYRGCAKYALGQYSAAILDFDKAIQIKSDYDVAYSNRGLAKFDLGQYSAAFADYDAAIRHNPALAVAYYNRGRVKYALGQYSAAIADYNTAIHLNSDYAHAFFNRGLANFEVGKKYAAITDFDTAIHLKPDYAAAYYNRGRAKIQLGLTTEAEQDLRSALKLAKQVGDENLEAKSSLVLRSIELKSQSLR